MRYYQELTLKDGRRCVLRNAAQQDGEAVLRVFMATHAETDYLLSYPDEITFTADGEGAYLQEKTDSPDEIEILAEVDGKAVGLAGIVRLDNHVKTRHRATFGVSILQEYWGLGIGRALTKACVECAEAAGYLQLELDVVAENKGAVALYESEGFTEYGRNPRGFLSRHTGWQTLILMRKALNESTKAVAQ